MGKSDRDTAPGPLAESDPELEALLARPATRMMSRQVILWIALFIPLMLLGVSTVTFVAVVGAVLLMLGAAFVFRYLALLSRARRLLRGAEHGQLDEAVQWHELNLPKAQHGQPRLMLAHDLGYYELRRGNILRALTIHSTTYRALRNMAIRDKRIVALNRDNMAMIYAVRGDTDSALAWLVDPASKHSLVPAAAAVVYARCGEWDRTVALEWPVLDPRLAKAMQHAKRVYAAMRALAKLARGDSDIADDLEVARLAFAGELDYLAADWPELKEIIARLPPPMPSPDAEGLPKSRLLR